ncbi:MAG: hypothetical protein CMF52_00310 [Legionellales bacterium]|mgnify:FL=1|nr:hypothetical protein [Legionellales bacterium]|tara:strand:- start:891 stop:1133 length:243 start_codon:yes stop_codon:yes gene_type:complete
MGAKHPMAVVAQLNANKNEFILAARHLVKSGVAKTPGDAIRYMEDNNVNVPEVMEQVIISKQTKLPKEEDNEDTSTEPAS